MQQVNIRMNNKLLLIFVGRSNGSFAPFSLDEFFVNSLIIS